MEHATPIIIGRRGVSPCATITKQCKALGWTIGDAAWAFVESGRIVIARAVPEPQPTPILPLKNVPDNCKDMLEPEEIDGGGQA